MFLSDRGVASNTRVDWAKCVKIAFWCAVGFSQVELCCVIAVVLNILEKSVFYKYYHNVRLKYMYESYNTSLLVQDTLAV